MFPRLLSGGAVLVLLVSCVALARAADPSEARVAVAKNVGESASIFRRSSPTWPWQPVKEGGDLYAGDLLVAGLAAVMETVNGDVRVAVQGDHADTDKFPIRETAVIFHPAKDVDLDFTLDRGRATITNQKKEGPAKVRVHIRGKSGEITLKEPGASFALEIYGRWPAGVPFKKDAKPEDGPPLSLVLLVLKGEVSVKGPKREGTLKAPPGLGMFITDNIEDPNIEPLFIEKLPAWAAGGEPSLVIRKVMAVGKKFREAAMEKPVGEVLDEMVKSNDLVERRVAVLVMGALDDLERLGDALMNAKSLDVWDAAVVALRHWIGRAPGQDQLLYKGLIEKRGFTPVQAEAVLSLLHSFGEEELSIPETYEMLLDYLENDRLAVRGLAYWHLIRLVPQGQRFRYDPTAAKEKREPAIKEWRKLIPTGKLPPKPALPDQ